MTLAQVVAERVLALRSWADGVRIALGGDGTDGTEARIVYDAEAWWLAISVGQASGDALARTGAIDLGGTHLATSAPVPAEDTDAVVRAAVDAREDPDGMRSCGRQRLSVDGAVWLVFDGSLTRALPVACHRAADG